MSEFVHLHCHSDQSLYDGFQTVIGMANTAKGLGFPGIALTDHGKIGGFIKLSKACKSVKDPKEGKEYLAKEIKPIYGCEIYMVDDLEDKKGKRYHSTILAKNNKGLENLYRIVSISSENTYRGFPRVDWKILEKYSEGLVILSGCIIGKFGNLIENGEIKEAEALAKRYKDIWGEDFYVEVMWTGYEPQKLILKYGVEIAERNDIKIVATNDVHYSRKGDGPSQRVKISISRNGPLPSDQYKDFNMYMKTPEEMMKAMGKSSREIYLRNTMEVFNKCNAEIVLGKAKLPVFEIPEENIEFNKYRTKRNITTPPEESYLAFLSEEGLKGRGLWDRPGYRERLYKELETIKFTGFDTYFLIVEDYCRYARDRNIRIGAGRGCFLPESKVVTDRGLKNIEEIFPGDIVLSHDKKYHEVEDTYEYDVDEEVIEVEVDDGRIIKCTKDHRILIKKEDESINWVAAKDLREGDEIVDLGK